MLSWRQKGLELEEGSSMWDQKWNPGFLPLCAQLHGLAQRFPKSSPEPGTGANSVPKSRFRGQMNLRNTAHPTLVRGS